MIFRVVRQHVIFIVLLISQPLLMLAQENLPAQPFRDFLSSLQSAPKPGEGNIIIHQDSRLVDEIVRLNESNSKKIGIAGYRIKIFSASGKDGKTKMLAELSRFVASFESVQTYPEYDPPWWKIYVGDFYTRSQAEKVKQMIIKQFPKSFVRVARVIAPDINN
jgi:SPOR domain